MTDSTSDAQLRPHEVQVERRVRAFCNFHRFEGIMWWKESVVEARVKQALKSSDWSFLKKPRGVKLDIYAAKGDFALLMECKGDVVEPSYDPAAYRNKYAQIILGQLLCRTGERQCGYGSSTLLAIAFPDPCKDDSHYFAEYLEDRLATQLRVSLKLCTFWVGRDLRLTVDIPDSVQPQLFGETNQIVPTGPAKQGITRYQMLLPEPVG
jgi:hypothetical protein